MEQWERWDSLTSLRKAAEAKTATPSLYFAPVVRGDGELVDQETLLDDESSSGMEDDSDEEDLSLEQQLRKWRRHRGIQNVRSIQSDSGVPPNAKTPALGSLQESLGTSSGMVKVSRLKLRALDFLSNITTQLETESSEPVESDWGAKEAFEDNNKTSLPDHPPIEPPVQWQGTPELHPEKQGESFMPDESTDDVHIGIRLRGTSQFTYVSRRGLAIHNQPSNNISGRKHVMNQLATQQKRQNAMEQLLLNDNIHDSSRVFMSWNKGYPAMVFSVIKYDESAESKRRKKLKLSSVIMEMPRRRNEVPKVLSDAAWLQKRWGTSYARYFNRIWAEASGDKVDPIRAEQDESWDLNYFPDALDDPRIRQGKHRTVQSLDGYYLSLLPYTKKKDLKSELNEVFREQNPGLPADLTLSKIRNLKREVLEHVRRLNLELSTAALAVVYFEKLVFKGVVRKVNRKLVMSVCLVLAFKFNEPKRNGMSTLKDLLDDIERVQSLSPKQVLEAEFPVFGHLLFHLNVNKEHVLAHFTRYLKQMESTPTEYLGSELALFYFPEDAVEHVSNSQSASANHHHSKKKHSKKKRKKSKRKKNDV